MARRLIFVLFVLLILSALATAQEEAPAIDPAALIEHILSVDTEQSSKIQDVVFDAELVEKEKDGSVKARFVKKVYLKYQPDTAWFYDDYLEYYKKDELQSVKDRDKQAAERRKKARKRKARNISHSMLTPFQEEYAADYEITYQGVDANRTEGFACHHFSVKSLVEEADHINGEYYFDAESFHLVKVILSPARLVKKMMFKLKELIITITYGPTEGGFWFPNQADVTGKGKAMLLIGVNFASTEYYRNPVINSGLADDIFVGEKNER